jgi:glucose-6-phosphate dehydrogenase assembly protein OpcA
VRGTIETSDWQAHCEPGDCVVMDLAWRGLRPWRQLISQSLDPSAFPGAIVGLREVEIEHGPHGLPQGWLLAGWLASALGWSMTDPTVETGRQMRWRLRGNECLVVVSLRRVELAEPQVCRVKTVSEIEGRLVSVTFESPAPGHLTATTSGFDAETRVLAYRGGTRASLVAAELEQLEPDHVFQRSFRVAGGLAEGLLRP